MEEEGGLCDWVMIGNQRGLHARAAARFVGTVQKFNAKISVCKDETTVSGHSIMGLMMLAAAPGTMVKICASGPEALAAMDAVTDLIKRNFDENK